LILYRTHIISIKVKGTQNVTIFFCSRTKWSIFYGFWFKNFKRN